MQHEHYTHTAPESSSDTAFAAYQYAAPLLSDLHAEITAVISTPQRHASLPDQLRMQPGIADVITVAKAAAQLRAAIFCAGVVIGTYRKWCSVPLPTRESAVPMQACTFRVPFDIAFAA